MGDNAKIKEIFLRFIQFFCTKLYRFANLVRLFSLPGVETFFIRLYFWYKSKLENFDLHLIGHLISPGSVVVDVGANIGWFTIMISKFLGKEGCVVAIEPDIVNSRRFQRALKLFSIQSKVRFELCALSNASGAGILHRDPENPANHQITKSKMDGEMVRLETLDELVKDETNISLVKIDVQGHELNVLEGGKQTFAKFKPAIIIEVDNMRNSRNSELIWEFMESAGYAIYFIENQGSEVTKKELLARKGYFDCICQPN